MTKSLLPELFISILRIETKVLFVFVVCNFYSNNESTLKYIIKQ